MKTVIVNLLAGRRPLTPSGPPHPATPDPSQERGEGRRWQPNASTDYLSVLSSGRFRYGGASVAVYAALAFLALSLMACGSEENSGVLAATTTSEVASNDGVEKVVSVTTLLTTSREVVEKISLPADLLPLRRAVLAAEVAGTVERVHIREGSRVGRGTLLVEIDTRSLRQRLAEIEAVHRHRDVLHQRAEKLLAKKSITEQQYLDALTERDVAAAQLETIQLELAKSRIAAPWPGTVAVKRVEVGDYVMPGQPVVELLDVRRLKVRAPAPASDVPYLRLGLAAEVRLDIFPDEVFSGEITHLAAELAASARTLDVDVEIENSDGRLRPGMYARLEIPRQTLEDAVLVPLAAIVELEESQVVYVVESERAVQRQVELGEVLGDEVVISAGLTAGERLIVEGQQQVSPGQRVRSN